MRDIEIRTEDGTCDAYVAVPAGEGPFPALVLLMDAPGVRDTLRDMADRLARIGLYVLLPNLYYRSGPYAPFDPATVFAGGPELDRLMALADTANDRNVGRDMSAFLAHFDAMPIVKKGKVALVGYCLGGGLAMRMACDYGERIAVAASFHGGRFLVTKEAPALLAQKARAKLYIGVAQKDTRHTREVTVALEEALAAAATDHTIEVYEGAKHGFAIADLPVYDRAHADHHWTVLGRLLGPLG